MSGVSLAAGSPLKELTDKDEGLIEGAVASISFFQIQMLAYIVVFSVSGLVPAGELGFVGFATVYIVILAVYVFPRVATVHPPGVVHVHRWFPFCVAAGSVIGLFLPMAYVLGGFSRGDKLAVSGATPHIFLLACQLLTEQIIVEKAHVSLPVRAIVPILYNARRLVSIGTWIRLAYDPESPKLGIWNLFGRTLAIVNLVFWMTNLCVFLIPLFLPRAFRKHFELEEEVKKGVPQSQLVEGSNGKMAGPPERRPRKVLEQRHPDRRMADEMWLLAKTGHKTN